MNNTVVSNTVVTSTPVVVTSTPVVVTSQEPERPVAKQSIGLCKIGVWEILIGLYAAGLCLYYVHLENIYGYGYAYSCIGVSAGILFIISGSLAIAAGGCPNRCNIVGGIIVAILASFAAVGVLIIEAVYLYQLSKNWHTVIQWPILVQVACEELEELECSPDVGIVVAHYILCVLAVVELMSSIIHAACCCISCRHLYTPLPHAGLTVARTYPTMQPVAINPGKGYVPLVNQPDASYPMTYAP